MRILLVTSTYPPHSNGQATFSGNLAEGLAQRGHEVAVLLPMSGWRMHLEQRNGVTLYHVPALALSSTHVEFAWPLRLRKAVREALDTFRPNLVHLQDSAPLSQVTMAEAHRRGLPVLVTHHPGPEIWAPYFSWLAHFFRPVVAWLAWTWMRLFLNRVDLVVTPSRAAAQVLVQHGVRAPVQAISCGVDWRGLSGRVVDRAVVRCASGLATDKPVFIYVGRLDPEKRLPVLLQAVDYLRNRPFQVVLAGHGSMESRLRRWVKEKSLGDHVHFLGQVAHEDLGIFLQAADVFVMPGDVESLSLATLEAMACGRPVIAARAMALPELVHHGQSGLLFHPGDAVDLATQMAWMLDHPEAWAAMGARGRELARDHDLANTLTQYEQVYVGLLRRIHHPVSQVRALRPRSMPLLRALAILLVVLVVVLLGDVYHTPAASASSLSAQELRVAVMQHLERLFEPPAFSLESPPANALAKWTSVRPLRVALFAHGEGRDCPPLILEWPPRPEQKGTMPESVFPSPEESLLIIESDWDRKALHMVWQPEGCAEEVPLATDAEGQRLLQAYGEQACRADPVQEDLEALRCSLQVLEAWVRPEP